MPPRPSISCTSSCGKSSANPSGREASNGSSGELAGGKVASIPPSRRHLGHSPWGAAAVISVWHFGQALAAMVLAPVGSESSHHLQKHFSTEVTTNCQLFLRPQG